MKPKNSFKDTVSLQKEYLCSLLLNYWHIKSPCVYLCDINLDLYNQISEEDKRFKLSEYYFGSAFIENQFELNKFFTFSGKVPLRNFKQLDSLIRIALFDIWIENDDRKPSNNNLLCAISSDEFEIYAIDHAFTFASLSFDSLSSEYLSFSDNDSILYSDVGMSIVKSLNIDHTWIDHIKDYFYLCINTIKADIDIIFETVPQYFSISDQEKESIKHYLFSETRNKEVLYSLFYIINHIRK